VAVIPYTANPASNSTDWANAVTALPNGAVEILDFDAHALGTLAPNNFVGVTLTGAGVFTSVEFSAGPGNPGSRPPASNGEGLHGTSNILFNSAQLPPTGSLTATFDRAVSGFGVMTIDLFNPTSNGNRVTLEAFDGPDGSGNSLGVATAAQFEFQQNFLYFLGLTIDANNIRSAVFTSFATDGDQMAIDHLAVGTIPEPSSMTMLLLPLAILCFGRRRRKR